MIKILKPGLYSSVQDCGRRGYRKFGVPLSGAMDPYALKKGNILLGNKPCCAAIEVTGPGFECEFIEESRICITGADIGCVIDGNDVLPGDLVTVGPGVKLSFGKINSGLRAYVHVRGGIDYPIRMGSN